MIVVYTSIIGKYDELREPLWFSKDYKFVCFTDQPLKSKIWQIVNIPTQDDKTRLARKIKIESKFDAELSIWIDGNLRVIGNLDKFIRRYKLTNFDFSLLTHPDRSTLAEEATAIVKFNKDAKVIVDHQVTRYKTEGYGCNELACTSIIVKKNKPIVNKQAEVWLNEVMTKSKRDQMSFNYACWKVGLRPHYIPFRERDERTFKYYLHPHKLKKK